MTLPVFQYARRRSSGEPGRAAVPRRRAWLKNGALICGMLIHTAALADKPEIMVSGLDNQLREAVLTNLAIASEPCDSPQWRVERLARNAADQAREALESHGYYSTAVKTQLDSSGACWLFTVRVDPGEPVRLRRIDVRLDSDPAARAEFETLLRDAPFEAGAVLSHETYIAYKRRFTARADRLGYFDAQFAQHRIDVYPDEHAADITLLFQPGVRYTFGDVIIDQNVIDPDLAQAYIDFSSGEPYDARRIADLYKALLKTGYFGSVDIRTQPQGSPDYRVRVTMQMAAAKHQTYTGGIGYGTDTGVKVRAGFLNRRQNRHGHQLELNGSWSKVIAEAGLSYRMPLDDPRNDWLNFDGGYRWEDNTSSTSETWKTGVKRFHQTAENWLITYSLDYGIEKYTVGADTGRTKLLTPGISWKHSVSGGAARPLSGVQANASLVGASEAVVSGVSFLQAHAFGKFVHPLWPGARGLGRAEFGYTATGAVDNLPATYRYFTGGDTSIRGYKYKSLGPTDAQGEPLGGKHLAVFSYEIEQLVYGKWAVAAFVDAGNAFNDFDDLETEVGVGVGIRWFSLLGPIRFDVAFPLAADAPDTFRIHVSLGPDL